MSPDPTKHAEARRTVVVGPAHVGKTRFARRLCSEGHWFLNLDPARQDHAPIACAGLLGPGEKPAGFRFIGSLGLWRDPLGTMEAALWATRQAGDEPIVVELPFGSPNHLSVHILRSLIAAIDADRIVVIGIAGAAAQLNASRLQVQEQPPLSEAHKWPPSAEIAWRRSAFRDYFGSASTQNLSLRDLSLQGARLGSGLPLEPSEMADLRSLGLHSAEYAEMTGSSLYVIAMGSVDSDSVTAASAFFACRNVHIANPRLFQGLLVGIEDPLGRHFALGRIIKTNFSEGTLTVLAPAESPIPADRLHFGHLRLSDDCDELGEIKPWQV